MNPISSLLIKLKLVNDQAATDKAKKELTKLGDDVGKNFRERLTSRLNEITGLNFAPLLSTFSRVGLMAAAGFSAAFAGIGLLMANAVSQSNEEFSDLQTAKKLGVTIQEFQELKEASDDVGISTESLVNGMARLNLSSYQAATDAKSASAGIFRALGINLQGPDGQLKNSAQLLRELVHNYRNLGTAQERSRVAQELMSRGGKDLLPLLTMTGEKLEAAIAQAHEYNLITKGNAEASVEMHEALDDLDDSWRGLKKALAGDFIKRVMVIGIKALTEVIVFLGKAVTWLTEKLDYGEGGVRVFSIALGVLATTLTIAAVPAIISAAGALLSMAAAGLAAAAPFVLLAGLLGIVALVLEDIYVGTQGGDSYFKDFMDWLKKPVDSPLLMTLKQITEAIFDIQGAWEKLSLSGALSMVTGYASGGVGGAVAGLYKSNASVSPTSAGASNTTSNNMNINVHAAPGMDEQKLAEKVANEIKLQQYYQYSHADGAQPNWVKK